MAGSVREVVLLPFSALMPLEEAVFQIQCRSSQAGASFLEAQLSACTGFAAAHTPLELLCLIFTSALLMWSQTTWGCH